MLKPYKSLGIDQEGRWNAVHPIGRRHAALLYLTEETLRPFHSIRADKILRRFGVIIDAQTNHGEPLVFAIRVIDGFEDRQFGRARSGPSGPEFQQDKFPAIIRQLQRFAIERHGFKGRGQIPHFQRPFRLQFE